jgi:hypothetical protein
MFERPNQYDIAWGFLAAFAAVALAAEAAQILLPAYFPWLADD